MMNFYSNLYPYDTDETRNLMQNALAYRELVEAFSDQPVTINKHYCQIRMMQDQIEILSLHVAHLLQELKKRDG